MNLFDAGYVERKQRAIFRWQARWVVGLSLFAYVFWAVIIRWGPAEWVERITKLSRTASSLIKRLGPELPPEAVDLLSEWMVPAAVVAVGWKTRKVVAQFAFDRFFDSFNDDLLDGIRLPERSVDGELSLPWIPPSRSTSRSKRVEVWEAMETWVSAGADLRAPGAVRFS